jgi:hypothetical protein
MATSLTGTFPERSGSTSLFLFSLASHLQPRAQLNHLAYSIRAFIRLEVHRLRRGISWYEAKASIIREAIRAYLAKPSFTLNPTA